MKDAVEINELVKPELLNLASRYLELEGANFNEHVKFLGLDPKTNFRFADLAGVDFSGANLRGFDFTGADLRGATGANVQWDGTTVLNGADTSDSLFAYRLQRDKFLSQNPAVAERIELLSKEYWTHAILGVENLLSDKKYPYGMKVARAVFDKTDDAVVRSNILLFMRLGVDSGEEHRQFIFNLIATHGSEVSTVRPALRALASLYPDNRGTLNILKAYVGHTDEVIREEVLGALINSRHLPNMIQDILPHLSGKRNEFLRRSMLTRIAYIAGPDYLAACRDTDVSNALDYEVLISERKMQSIAEAAILRERYHEIANSPRRANHEKRLEEGLSIKEQKIRERAAEYKGLLIALRHEYQIPLCFEPDKPQKLDHAEAINTTRN